jgi:hypothetical protein
MMTELLDDNATPDGSSGFPLDHSIAFIVELNLESMVLAQLVVTPYDQELLDDNARPVKYTAP